jgi:hypothetical protein
LRQACITKNMAFFELIGRHYISSLQLWNE